MLVFVFLCLELEVPKSDYNLDSNQKLAVSTESIRLKLNRNFSPIITTNDQRQTSD